MTLNDMMKLIHIFFSIFIKNLNFSLVLTSLERFVGSKGTLGVKAKN